MKKLFLSTLALFFVVFGYAQVSVASSPTEQNDWLTSFESMVIDGPFDIKFVQIPDTDAPKIVYDTKGSYTSKFSAEVKDRILRISEKYDSRRFDRTEVTVYYTSVQSIKLSGAAASFADTLRAVQLDLTIGREAKMTAVLNVKDLRMNLSGGSVATLSGEVRYLSLFASTGTVAASDLQVMSAEVNSQSKADVSLWVTDRFIGKTTTNGRITYKGQPSVVRSGAKFMGGEINHEE